MLIPDPFPTDHIRRSVTRCTFDITLIGRREYCFEEDPKEQSEPSAENKDSEPKEN